MQREEVDYSASSGLRRWHPKLTPYRLLVLGTTIGVGTAKAVAAQEGKGSASTTLEWVSGVVIFLILYSMNTYDETPKDPPPLLRWLFTVDCMDNLWRLLSFVHIPHPLYSSEPEPTPRFDVNGDDEPHAGKAASITLYRLFVCFTTSVFGLTKAIVTYFGYSVGASWVDWTLGVVVTSVLFIMGMYENNTVGAWHAFFVADHSTGTRVGFAAATIATITTIVSADCIWLISTVWGRPNSAFLSTDYVRVPLTALPPLAVLREQLFDACFLLIMVYASVGTAFIGVSGVSAVLSSSGLPRWVHVGGWMGDWMFGRRSAWKDGYSALGREGRRLSTRIAYHTALLITFLLGCAVFLAFWVISVAANVEEGYTLHHGKSYLLAYDTSGSASPISNPNWVHFAFLAAAILLQLSSAGVTVFLMWFVAAKTLLAPFWRWRDGDENWERDVLF